MLAAAQGKEAPGLHSKLEARGEAKVRTGTGMARIAAKMSFRPGKKPSETHEKPTEPLSTGKAFSLSTGISAKMSFLPGKKPNAKNAKPKVKTQTLSFHPKIEKDALPVSVSECNRIIAVNKFDLAAGLEVGDRITAVDGVELVGQRIWLRLGWRSAQRPTRSSRGGSLTALMFVAMLAS